MNDGLQSIEHSLLHLAETFDPNREKYTMFSYADKSPVAPAQVIDWVDEAFLRIKVGNYGPRTFDENISSYSVNFNRTVGRTLWDERSPQDYLIKSIFLTLNKGRFLGVVFPFAFQRGDQPSG